MSKRMRMRGLSELAAFGVAVPGTGWGCALYNRAALGWKPTLHFGREYSD